MIQKNLKENIEIFNNILPIKESFDIVGRTLDIGEKEAYLVFVDGFAKDDIMLRVLEDLQGVTKDDNINSIHALINKKIAYIEVETMDNIEKLKTAVLSGSVVMIVDGEDKAIVIDAREYPARSPEESQVEKVTRGARDGFVETLIFNTALIRRRIRDEKLIFHMNSVGERSKTDVAIAYIDDLADDVLLKNIKEKINSIDVPALLMAEKSLEELLIKKKWYNPLPQAKFTERPDVVSAHLLEGHIAIIVDTSPSVILLPTTIFYFSQYAEDYYQNPLIGTFTRLIRFLAILVALFLTPVWLILAENVDKLPEFLKFLEVGEMASSGFSLLLQLILLEFGIELLKLSSLHTPENLGASFGIIGGLIIGELAINVGLFSVETIFFTAVTAIANYCIPNVEFAAAIRFFRLIILILAGVFGWIGFVIGTVIMLLIVYNTNTFDKRRKYTWPLIPFDKSSFINVMIRRPIIDIKRTNKK